MNSHQDEVEPFPDIEPDLPDQQQSPSSPLDSSPGHAQETNMIAARRSGSIIIPSPTPLTRTRGPSSFSGRLRSVSGSFAQSSLPPGFLAATGGFASSVLSGQQGQRLVVDPENRPSLPGLKAEPNAEKPAQADNAKKQQVHNIIQEDGEHRGAISAQLDDIGVPASEKAVEPEGAAAFPNGYHFPPSKTCAQSTKLGLLAFWSYVRTPGGFLVTVYGLNVVAWGGMLFLLLCEASMCHPNCNDVNSARRKWIEWDSQILNALFCVTGFGLAPWRFRDLWFLLEYRVTGRNLALRRLAGIHRGWFRLRGSDELPPEIGPRVLTAEVSPAIDMSVVPHPVEKIPDAPLTGVRAPPSRTWMLDLVIWLMVSNTFFQCVLCAFMWGMNRYDRPSWATGVFVALGCTVAGVAGILMFIEGRKVKGIEGVPLTKDDREQLERDKVKGVWHYNNIKDRDTRHPANQPGISKAALTAEEV